LTSSVIFHSFYWEPLWRTLTVSLTSKSNAYPLTCIVRLV